MSNFEEKYSTRNQKQERTEQEKNKNRKARGIRKLQWEYKKHYILYAQETKIN